jgi:enterochelin esterase family protein
VTVKPAKLLECAQNEGTPLIDGETATFLWHGEAAPRLIGDFNFWGSNPGPIELTPIAPDIWAHSQTLPRDACLEYAYLLGDARVLDPFNARGSLNGLGEFNQFFTMPEFVPAPVEKAPKGTPRGTVSRHSLQGDHLIVGGKRTVHLYRPAAPGPYPLLLVWDGQDYLHLAHLTRILDNLIAQQRIRPIALAMPEHGGQARFVEYACSESTLAFVGRRVLPLATAQLDLLDIGHHPGAFGVLGASMGGLMALYTGLRAPQVFGKVLSQSGAFGLEQIGNGPIIDELVGHLDTQPVRIWMDVGRYEWLLDSNRRMHDRLTRRGYEVNYHEYAGAHNYTVWRSDVVRGLEEMFGP